MVYNKFKHNIIMNYKNFVKNKKENKKAREKMKEVRKDIERLKEIFYNHFK